MRHTYTITPCWGGGPRVGVNREAPALWRSWGRYQVYKPWRSWCNPKPATGRRTGGAYAHVGLQHPWRSWCTSCLPVFSTESVVPAFMPTFTTNQSQNAGPPPSASLVIPDAEAAGGDLQSVTDSSIPGIALIPPKLVQKILKGDDVDMHELLPETWRAEEPRDSCCRSIRPKRGLVTDISLWTECYASLVAVLTTKYPDKAPHFMGYLRTIVRASRNFEGSAWASYDAAYRRQAANRRSFDWSIIDPTIYNEAFTGRARVMSRCRYCLADTHDAHECQYAPGDDPPPSKQPRSANWGTVTSNRPDRASQRMVELCELYNSSEGNRCSFKWCRFAHVCAKCKRGPHPAAECNRSGAQRGGLTGPPRPRKEEEPPRRRS